MIQIFLIFCLWCIFTKRKIHKNYSKIACFIFLFFVFLKSLHNIFEPIMVEINKDCFYVRYNRNFKPATRARIYLNNKVIVTDIFSFSWDLNQSLVNGVLFSKKEESEVVFFEINLDTKSIVFFKNRKRWERIKNYSMTFSNVKGSSLLVREYFEKYKVKK